MVEFIIGYLLITFTFEYLDDKFNHVDIKAKNDKDEIIIIEVQNTRELYYLERILYGVAKAIRELK